LSTRGPWFTDSKDLPPELRLLYFLSVRYSYPSSEWGYKLRYELGLDKLEQDAQLFQKVTKRLLDEGLVSLESMEAPTSSGKGAGATTLDLTSMARMAEDLYPTAKGRKLLQYISLNRRNLRFYIGFGILGLVFAGILSIALYLGLIGTTQALLELLQAGLFLAMGAVGVWILVKRRRLIEDFEEGSPPAATAQDNLLPTTQSTPSEDNAQRHGPVTLHVDKRPYRSSVKSHSVR
jgi:hypothetical protein